MHRVPAVAQCLKTCVRTRHVYRVGLPILSCPALGPGTSRQRTPSRCRRLNHTEAALPAASDSETSPVVVQEPDRKIPIMCSGCGAFSQTTKPGHVGYFDMKSKRVRTWLRPSSEVPREKFLSPEDQVVANVLTTLDRGRLEQLGLSADRLIKDDDGGATAERAREKPPVCDRCYDLMHYNTKGDTAKLRLPHPTVESLRETIEESPYRINHIYHVIDAADFPMSLVPKLNVLLGDIPLRSKNRRSRKVIHHHKRRIAMSFVITRSDLLGPTKEIVDSLMPYLREVLRDALGPMGKRVRLGNVTCVSAKRSWWTGSLKESLWSRGGATWMVGKVNVGKSQLFEAIFPKGRLEEAKKTALGDAVSGPRSRRDAASGEGSLGVGELLPPAQPATNFPGMPMVSSLPGTTVSPIRVPFGNRKGELIDLPGLYRGGLEQYVQEDYRHYLTMKARIVPVQASLDSRKSLLLGGGLIRITPRNRGVTFLMYNFTPMDEHTTSTEKAISYQNQTRKSISVRNIAIPDAMDKMKHAGTFKLLHDVTKERAGPLARRDGFMSELGQLPFRVFSVDLLIEGVGYVEIVAQVRTRHFEKLFPEDDEPQLPSNPPESSDVSVLTSEDFTARFKSRGEPAEPAGPDWPAVDVYSPEGSFIGARQPIHGWLNNKARVLPKHKRARPRLSRSGLQRVRADSKKEISIRGKRAKFAHRMEEEAPSIPHAW